MAAQRYSGSIWAHPVVQALMPFLGAYMVFRLLIRLWPPLLYIFTVGAVLFAIVHWLLAYDRRRLYHFYLNPVSGAFIDLVCKATNEQPPVDASVDAPGASAGGPKSGGTGPADPETPYRKLSKVIRNQSDFADIVRSVKAVVKGHDENVEKLLAAVRTQVELRARSHVEATQPPLGIFLLVGPRGIGKRHLAMQVGNRLYSEKSTFTIDLAGGADPTKALTDAARTHPYATLILDGIDSASDRATRLIQKIAATGFVEDGDGAKTSFRHCFLFLISEKAAETIIAKPKDEKEEPRLTEMMQAITRNTILTAKLASLVQGVFILERPGRADQAAVVALLMQIECRKYQLELGSVEPEFIIREVKAVTKQRGFELLPGRIQTRMKEPILRAIQGKLDRVGGPLRQREAGMPDDDLLARLTDKDALMESLEDLDEDDRRREIVEEDMQSALKGRVKGQDHVVDDVTHLIRLQWGKTQRKRPIANILFLGPTGTGKTELAKTMAEYLFSNEQNMLRFDCSEFTQGGLSKDRLIGMPTGYVGANKGGALTRPVINNPRRLILFDEIEKAAPDVFDLFLQVMGDGRLTEAGSGRVADFTECIIILTSNAEAEAIVKLMEEMDDYHEMVNAVKSHLAETKVFRPEIMGRIDKVYVFKPLKGRVVAEIAALKMMNLAGEYGLELAYVDFKLLANAVHQGKKLSRFGIRELDRVINDMLGEAMLGAREAGHKRVCFHVDDAGDIDVRPAPDEERQEAKGKDAAG